MEERGCCERGLEYARSCSGIGGWGCTGKGVGLQWEGGAVVGKGAAVRVGGATMSGTVGAQLGVAMEVQATIW